MTRSDRPLTVLARPSPLLVLSALAGIYGMAVLVASQMGGLACPSLLAAALTVDLVILAPVIYYFGLVRSRGWDRITVVPVLFVSFGPAVWLLPPEHRGLLVILLVSVGLLQLFATKDVTTNPRRPLRLNTRWEACSPENLDDMAPQYYGSARYEDRAHCRRSRR